MLQRIGTWRWLSRQRIVKDETGTAAMEEGLIMALVSVSLVVILVIVGRALGALYETIRQAIATAFP